MRELTILRTAVLAGLLSAAGTAPVSAQFAVFDAATTARNQTTAALKELLYRLQVQQHVDFYLQE